MEEDFVKIVNLIEGMTDRFQEQSEIIARLTNICAALTRKCCELRVDVDKLIENNRG